MFRSGLACFEQEFNRTFNIGKWPQNGWCSVCFSAGFVCSQDGFLCIYRVVLFGSEVVMRVFGVLLRGVSKNSMNIIFSGDGGIQVVPTPTHAAIVSYLTYEQSIHERVSE